jgi:hypothetical protein
VSEWLPIETAPRDGSAVLGFEKQGNHPGDWSVIRWTGYEFEGDRIGNPTHWMPLPAPPLAAVRGDADGSP